MPVFSLIFWHTRRSCHQHHACLLAVPSSRKSQVPTTAGVPQGRFEPLTFIMRNECTDHLTRHRRYSARFPTFLWECLFILEEQHDYEWSRPGPYPASSSMLLVTGCYAALPDLCGWAGRVGKGCLMSTCPKIQKSVARSLPFSARRRIYREANFVITGEITMHSCEQPVCHLF